MSALRILLVEDSIASAFIMEEQIHRQDPEMLVRVETTLAGCLEELPKIKPHIVIIDLGLPDSRWDETILFFPRLRPALILAMSADPSFGAQAMEHGADEFMPKLIGENSGALMDRIKRLAGRCNLSS